MKRLGQVIFTVAVVLVTATSSETVATAAPDGEVTNPHRSFGGWTGNDVMGELWYQLITLPEEINPIFGNGERCMQLADNVVMILNPAGVTCTVELGTAVWVNNFSGFCDSASAPPFFGGNAREQRRCTWDLLGGVVANTVSIDGRRPVDTHGIAWRICSPQRFVADWPEAPGQDATFTGCGWGTWITRLPVGTHTVAAITTFEESVTRPSRPASRQESSVAFEFRLPLEPAL